MSNKRYIAIALVFGMACSGPSQKQEAVLDTPTSGKLIIAADEALRPIVEAQIAAFEGIYTQADIEAVYLPEQQAVEYMLADSAVLAVVTRTLTAGEKEQLQAGKIWPAETRVAGDALAVILNAANPDTLFTTEQLVGVLRGEQQQWKELNAASSLGDIQVVFDNARSGAVRVLKDSLAGVSALPPNCFAVNSNPEVVAHVQANPNAIGIIGVSWVSDTDDSLSQQFIRDVKIAALYSAAATDYVQPYQAYLAQKFYPLQRSVYVLSREARAGLGSGFTSFVASERGQRIVLKAGLVPATMPLRIVQLTEEAEYLTQ
ncbi:PstS family phosphate ABC transporter substrate-binding protein [Cesiribacter sp. SM1]|uniref:PstS family phosphate ABC transporter substrate-binding protein n=1 Tax=Cesiribacter sp. SM1 TaxID=2861196 RepID=UPI001CD758E8|nr:substrate-binding domain-containing protein [Cesiribacter sp. SM1]